MRARHLHRVSGSRHLAAAHREETHERSWLPSGATTNGVSDVNNDDDNDDDRMMTMINQIKLHACKRGAVKSSSVIKRNQAPRLQFAR